MQVDVEYAKLEIFAPPESLEEIRAALASVDAGHIGRYDSCLSYGQVTGTWRPLEGADPFIGSVGEVSEEPELKIECTVRLEALRRTIDAVKEAHPYEEPVINAIPLIACGL